MNSANPRLQALALIVFLLGFAMTGELPDHTACAQESTPGSRHEKSSRLAPVVRIEMDGRIVLKSDEQEAREVTLIGVEWPEGEYAGPLHEFLEHLLLGEAVYVDEPATITATTKPAGDGKADRGDEPAKAVYLRRAPDRLFVNIEVLRLGYARVLTKPSFAQLGDFREAEKKARDAGKGVWAEGGDGASRESGTARPDRVNLPKRLRTGDEKTPDVSGKKPDGKAADIVFVTPSGKKYHQADCRFAAKSKSIALDEAIKKGYTACSRCKPATR